MRGINSHGGHDAHLYHAFFVEFARRDGFLGVRQVHRVQGSPDANLGETNLFVLIQVRFGENQTDDGSHQHDAGPVHLRVLDSSSLPSHVIRNREEVSHDHLKKKPKHPRVMPKRHFAVVVAGLNQTLPAGKLDVWTTDANKPMNTKEAMIPGVFFG